MAANTTEEVKNTEKKKTYRSFTCKTVANGFIVTVGCQQLVFKTLLDLTDVLIQYWNGPDETEKRILNDSIQYGREPLQGSSTVFRGCPTTRVDPYQRPAVDESAEESESV